MSDQPNPTLFRIARFMGHSGDDLTWKVECEALSDTDWACLAMLASRILPIFGSVEGVPQGGLRFARALEHYRRGDPARLLIADDVLTTGRSLEEARAGRDAMGVVAFSRTVDYPTWVMPIWTLHYGIGR